MPTNFKRYKCLFCKKPKVVWKLRKLRQHSNEYVCQSCIDLLYNWTSQYTGRPPVKKEVLSRSTIVKVPVKIFTGSPDFGD